MKTEQAIRKLGQTLWDILGREYIDKYCEDKNGNLVSVSSISVEDIAEELVNSGYGNIKQAQIDVLKKIKNCREATDSDCYPYLERIVNKVIEEVQNGEDKG